MAAQDMSPLLRISKILSHKAVCGENPKLICLKTKPKIINLQLSALSDYSNLTRIPVLINIRNDIKKLS